ncbi:unnamed protein product [Lactuca virosa]|uniref:DUF632 domain-containing protein n=1 Tax=Lactuca virosa TaxID=75947 RepID=A0AAU9NXT2_9ASTR|nr:unnamed protein product [Lactuca virosa]
MEDDKRRHVGGGGFCHRAVVESEKEPPLSSMKEDVESHTDHSTRVTTWKHLFKGYQISNHDEDNYAPKEKQSHYMILDNILAWEKKLYDKVKAGEEMKYVYKKKSASLNKLTKRGTSSDSLMRMIAKRTPTYVVDEIEVIAEHQIAVEALKRRLEEEEEAYR